MVTAILEFTAQSAIGIQRIALYRHPVLVTSTLLVHAQNTIDGTKLIARNKLTGQEIAAIGLPGNPNAAPMSFSADGRQYIAVAVSGQSAPELIVYALPK